MSLLLFELPFYGLLRLSVFNSLFKKYTKIKGPFQFPIIKMQFFSYFWFNRNPCRNQTCRCQITHSFTNRMSKMPHPAWDSFVLCSLVQRPPSSSPAWWITHSISWILPLVLLSLCSWRIPFGHQIPGSCCLEAATVGFQPQPDLLPAVFPVLISRGLW